MVVCDEGSSLVKLLGQLGKTESGLKRVTFRQNLFTQEINEQADEILDALEIDEHDEIANDLDVSLDNVQTQLNEMEKEVESINFSKQIHLSTLKEYSNLNTSKNEVNFNISEEELYNLKETGSRKIGILKELKIQIGGTELPRFSCSNHKLSVTINSALIKQGFLLNHLKSLSNENSFLRKSIKSNRIFLNLKCRPRIYQKTRWCGAILLLYSNKRAYDKGAYEESNTCPVSLETIELYIQILNPAYFTTLGWEKNSASIADVIPQVLMLIDIWTKMDINDAEAKELCFFLIHYIKIKFKYELESPVYHVIF